MQTITASTLKQNSMLLQNALRGDLLVTKRDKPFVVVMDYKKYEILKKYIQDIPNDTTKKALKELKKDEGTLTYKSKKELFDDLDL